MGYLATIGFFDGVHIGHSYLLNQLRLESAKRGLLSAVITFEQSPKTVITGQLVRLLTTFDQKIELLKGYQVDEIYCFQFPLVQSFTAHEFMSLLSGRCAVKGLLMGYDHRFGSDGLVGFEQYERIGKSLGLEMIRCGEAPQLGVSSSLIRRALSNGCIGEVNRMLGREYSLMGCVVHGKGIGRQLGYPTANLDIDKRLHLPANGVYAVRVCLPNGNTHRALLNIGNNPTIQTSSTVTVELHIPNIEVDLYGSTLEVVFERRLREEIRFSTRELLQEQIHRDIAAILG